MQPIAAGGQPVMAIAAWQSQVGPALRLRTRRKQFNGSPATLNSTGERAVNCNRRRQVRLVTFVRLTLRKIWSRCPDCNSQALVSDHRM